MSVEEDNCIFCKIINGIIPSYKVYENEYVFALLDINPIVRGHTLVIPKKHFVNIFDCDEFYLQEVIKAVKLISSHFKKVLNCDVNVLNASGKDAEQSVFHLHFHILPRFETDNFKTFPTTGYEKEDLEEIMNTLKI